MSHALVSVSEAQFASLTDINGEIGKFDSLSREKATNGDQIGNNPDKDFKAPNITLLKNVKENMNINE